MHNTGDLTALRNSGVSAAAQLMGIKKVGPGYPCPVCGQAKRHRKRKDKRGAVGLRPDGLGWRCFQCDASGDAVSYLAAAITGTVQPDKRGWKEVFNRIKGGGFSPPKYQAPRPIKSRRPSFESLAALYDASVRVTESTEASAWLHLRGFDPWRVAEQSPARAIPYDAVNLPEWASIGGVSWPEAGFSLFVPLYAPNGALASVQARATREGTYSKSASPKGYQISGTIMADTLGGRLLRGDKSARDWVVDKDSGIVIAEGLPNFIAWCVSHSDADLLAPAVFGVFAGGWNSDFAAKVPDGCRVTIDTDHDDAGNKYAQQIKQTFKGRNVRLNRIGVGKCPQ